ncbi:HNH endonuclease [Planctomycetaceae bacterium]|nr:HNH endonuclease [Planctomycetaceae bacterium]
MDQELLDDLAAASRQLQSTGKKLTFRSYREVGNYSSSTIAARFGSWNNALKKAGLILNEEKDVSIDELFDNLKLVWIAKGKQPVYRDMSCPPSKYAGSTYNSRFGGWRNALKKFVTAFEHESINLTSSTRENRKRIQKRASRNPPLSLRFFVLKRDNFRCNGCGRSPASTSGLELEVDHIQPWSKGGDTVATNLQTLCFDCNRGKGASLPF